MIFEELPIPGAFVVTPEPITDERGAFARVFAIEEFVARGIDTTIIQMSVASNAERGTLRGMHLQAPPHGETKLVRCIRGSAFDVIVDLRPQSAAFLTWASVAIDAQQRNAVSIPEGVAHGYLTLEADTELEYSISAPYTPSSAVGLRWDDPAIGIEWPFAPAVIGARDAAFPFIDPARLRAEGIGSLRPQGVQP